jgi:glucose-6-phosphate 1-dehydrogenase
MIQNHLLQILCLIAMEAPVSFNADEVRNKKADVLHALRHIPIEQVHKFWGARPVRRKWGEVKPSDFPHYHAGTWGPEASEILVAQDGLSWVVPSLLRCHGDTAVCEVTMARC